MEICIAKRFGVQFPAEHKGKLPNGNANGKEQMNKKSVIIYKLGIFQKNFLKKSHLTFFLILYKL
jgi:hypothetical protein